MKVLFIGGTGIISSACTQLALEQGLELYLLNRGRSFRPVPPGAKVLNGDIRNPDSARRALAGHSFDVVVDWVAFTTDHIEADLVLFKGKTKQYVFISSASAYHTPPLSLPVTESTPLFNPVWQYSRNKIACEERLMLAYRQEGFPVTIVRPSHTYDASLLPMEGGYTTLHLMQKGQEVIVHGDGTSLWTLTHHRDFAKGFNGLLGNPHALGESVHITSEEVLTWNQIFALVAEAAGVTPKLVHVPSELIAAYNKDWGDGLLGDKAHSMTFDNTKIKRLVPGFQCAIPFVRGAEEIVAWYAAHPEKQVVDEKFVGIHQRILEAYKQAWPRNVK